MNRNTARRALPFVALFSTLALTAGGWMVTTVKQLPDHLVVGQPTEMTFTVRGHGRQPVAGLGPTLEATSGMERVSIPVSDQRNGSYVARVAVPDEGSWTLTFSGSYRNGHVSLLPIAAVAPGARAPVLTDMERGRRLFTAKGCVTCHVQVGVGPKLDGRRWDAGWLARFLADPATVKPPAPGAPSMPDLDLGAKEITSLVAYLNRPTMAVSK